MKRLLALPAQHLCSGPRPGTHCGSVSDSSGALIPRASIALINEKNGLRREVSADNNGRYAITNLSPSVYTVTALSKDLGPAEVKAVVLSVGQERTLNLILNPASVTSEVRVGRRTHSSGYELRLDRHQREFPGSRHTSSEWSAALTTLFAGAWRSDGRRRIFDNIRFSGRANQQNAVRFDGIEGSSIVDASPGNLNGETSTGFRLQSSLETVAEFRVESSNYPAEYGTGTAGQISVVSKSGSNEFHGGLFEYIRNSRLDARNFFDGATKTPLRLNQFGGSVGGPIQEGQALLLRGSGNSKAASGHQPDRNGAQRGRAGPGSALHPAPAGRLSQWDADVESGSGPRHCLGIHDPTNTSAASVWITTSMSKLNAYVRYNRDQGYLRSLWM